MKAKYGVPAIFNCEQMNGRQVVEQVVFCVNTQLQVRTIVPMMTELALPPLHRVANRALVHRVQLGHHVLAREPGAVRPDDLLSPDRVRDPPQRHPPPLSARMRPRHQF